jgi:hypothetical protein
MSLTLHQKKVLGALLALEQQYQWAWWDRDAIGAVVDAGGFHQIIQQKTIDKLRERGLVQSQASHWPAKVQALVRCGCACHYFGLTEAGRAAANEITFRITEDVRQRLDHCELHATNWLQRGLDREAADEEQ